MINILGKKDARGVNVKAILYFCIFLFFFVWCVLCVSLCWVLLGVCFSSLILSTCGLWSQEDNIKLEK